jgi:L-iditol 2-dehydrogenase
MCPTGVIFSVQQDGTFSNSVKKWEITPNLNLIRIKSVGLCASDFSRIYKNSGYQYPLTPGHEIFGVVESTTETSELSEGDTVTVFPLLPCWKCDSCGIGSFQLCSNYSYFGSRTEGALGTYLLVPDWNLKKISSTVTLAVGNQVEPLSVVIHALRKFKAQGADQHLLISGGGFLTYLATEAAKFLGVTNLCVTTNSVNRRDYFRKLAETVDSHGIEADRFNSYLDFSGNFKTFEEVCMKLKSRSEVVIVANRREDTFISPKSWDLALRKELVIQGSWNSSFSPNLSDDDWDLAIHLLESEVVRNLYPHKEVPLSELPEFFRDLHRDTLQNLHNKLVPRVSVNV